ncbi:MAG: prohibitin family protein [Gallionella sp.]|nr:prohibitin family protein [Gallionella sp.]MDD4960508.1 prohibitin family protein [Gallionella sp.]
MAIFDNQSGIVRKLPNFPVVKWLIVATIFFVVVLPLVNPLVVIQAGHRGVITTFGKVNQEVLGEGLHFRIPFMQEVHQISVQIQKGEGDGDSASKDLQSVHTKVAINFHLVANRVAETFQSVGNLSTVGDRIIVPAVQEAVKATTAKYTAEELISKRAEVRDLISSTLKERMNRHGIAIDEVSIVNFAFSPSFNQAIEAKTTAEQLKLKAERDLQRIEVEAKQKVASAKAEAESLSLQRAQVTPEMIRLREVENQSEAIKKWDGHLPNVTGGGAIPFINVTK